MAPSPATQRRRWAIRHRGSDRCQWGEGGTPIRPHRGPRGTTDARLARAGERLGGSRPIAGPSRNCHSPIRSSQWKVIRSVNNSISAILPRGTGHQFLLYGDSCSGVPCALHEQTFASVNAVVQRLRPQPEFILFPGDEIIGLTPDADALRAQWRYWFDTEMAWLDRATIPVWHTTGAGAEMS